MFKPIRYSLPNGDIVLLYTMGHLVKRLGFLYRHVYDMFRMGVLPRTPFKDKRGFSLFTQDQIDIFCYYISRLPDKSFYNQYSRKYTRRFINRVARKHDQLLAEYGLKKGGASDEDIKTKGKAVTVRARKLAERQRATH